MDLYIRVLFAYSRGWTIWAGFTQQGPGIAVVPPLGGKLILLGQDAEAILIVQ